MRDTSAPEDRTRTSRPVTPRLPDTAVMWENLCRADELLEECEFLAAARAACAPEFATPSEEAPRG